MEQTVGGVHVPGDSQAYASHQHNGFHMSTSNTGSAGEATHPIMILPRIYMPQCQSSTEGFWQNIWKCCTASCLFQASAWPRSCKVEQGASSLQAQRRAFSSRWAALNAAWATSPPSTQRHKSNTGAGRTSPHLLYSSAFQLLPDAFAHTWITSSLAPVSLFFSIWVTYCIEIIL